MKNHSKENDAVAQLQEKPSPGEFMIVGLGASAGGVHALQEFFRNVPDDSGMAYVVILHLSPDHDSQLASVLQNTTRVPVTRISEKTRILANHIYVVPPNQHLTMEESFIVLSENTAPEDRRAPVDIFFRTLADQHGSRAIAVVLSGTGANGSMGLKRVKERGGACFVQNPREAEFNEMPRNAIATELVDEVLPVAEIPSKLLSYKRSQGSVQIVKEADLRPKDQQQALREIFTELRVHTGHDFSNYKRPTLLRRIERRINVRGMADLPSYARFLQDHPEEPAALLKDLLISVTNFFRDKKPFEVLEQEVLPVLFKGKSSNDQVRIWVAGCATGEEAYSLAMLCAERALGSIDAPKIQIFATDIDIAAIAQAREGLYTLNDAADVSPERLRRFFIKEGDAYRIRREIRETIMFAQHNMLKDPPFSHLDLVTCRNVMIYLNQVAQERATETFHFSLRPGGFLFLGTSESVDSASDLYTPFNRDNHIFQTRHAGQRAYPIPESTPSYVFDKYKTDSAALAQGNKTATRVSFGDLHQQLLEEYAPPSLVVNEEYEIVHLTEKAGRYLQVGGGELSNNLLKLVKPELRLDMRSALYQASQRHAPVETRGLPVQIDSRAETVNIHIRPVTSSNNGAKGFMLVLFEPNRQGQEKHILVSSEEPVTQQLEEELMRLKAQLRSSNEQHDFQAEEMKATNEELQAMNEELRSSSEELETSKEELQSINEELRTVNQELKVKIEETSIYSNNLQNLINSTDIGAIFLDRSFRVVLYTPASTAIFNLISSDYGRPLSDITNRLDKVDLVHDAEIVMDKLTTVEREVRTRDGKIYVMRISPYRTDEDRIRGVVATFMDITRRKHDEEKLQEAAAFSTYRNALNEALQQLDKGDNILSVASSMLGSKLQADRVYFSELEGDGEHARIMSGYHRHGMMADQEDLYSLREFSRPVYHDLSANRLVVATDTMDLDGHTDGETAGFQLNDTRAFIAQPVVKSNRLQAVLWVITPSVRQWRADEIALATETAERAWAAVERFRAEEALRKAEEQYRQRLEKEVQERTQQLKENTDLLQSVFDSTLSTITVMKPARNGHEIVDFELTFANKAAYAYFPGDAIGQSYARLYPGVSASVMADWMKKTVESGTPQDFDLYSDHNGLHQWFHMTCVKLRDSVLTISEDITTRKQADEEILRMKDELNQRTSDKYYSIFNSIDEAFAYCELVLDEAGQPVSYRLLEVNPAFENLVPGSREEGHGKDVGQLVPGTDAHWLETYAKVALTGESFRSENHVKELDRWFDIFAAPVGEKGNGRFALVFQDITERKRREVHLEFLAKISEHLVGLTGIDATMNQVAGEIGHYLHTARCAFIEIRDPEYTAEILHEWHKTGMADSAARYAMSSIVSPEFIHLCKTGAVIVVNNTAESKLVSAAQLEQYFGATSLMAVPLLRNGDWVFMLAVYDTRPRDWRNDERTLLQDLTTRIWTGLERARAEEALRASEEQLRITMESAVDYAIISTNAEGKIIGWNSGAERIFQYTQEEVASRSISLIFAPEDITEGIPEKEMDTAREMGRAADDRWHVRKDGTRFFMSGVLTPVYNPDLTGYVKVATDMTEQQKAQAILQVLEERYRIALKSAEMAAWDWNVLQDLVVWNDQHYYLLGLQPDGQERKSVDFIRYVHEEDVEAVEAALQKALNETGVYIAEFRIRRADNGEIKWMSGYGRALTEQEGRATRMVGVMYDITTRKQLEQQKDDFIGIASHELKTPVTSIKAYTELLYEMVDDAEDSENLSLVGKLNVQVDRLIDLIYTLLDTTKIAQGQLVLRPEPFSLLTMIREKTEELQRLTEKHRLVLLSESDVTITADKERLQQVFTNLVSNAIKYSPQGGEVTIAWKEADGQVEVSVADRGMGIPDSLQKKVFERFFRALDRTGQTFPGMGLGLYITANIIQRHGGTIRAESREGGGTVFYFTLPVHYLNKMHENSNDRG